MDPTIQDSTQTFKVQGVECKLQGAGLRVQGSEVMGQGSEFRVQGSGFRVQGSGDLRRTPEDREKERSWEADG